MKGRQSNLFEPELPFGLAYVPDIVSPAEETELVAQIGALPLAPFEFQGWLGKREVISFGWRYDFNAANFAPAQPIPPFLLPLRARAADFTGMSPDRLAQALVTRYSEDAGIGWHRDRPVFDIVVGISLLSPCTLRFRRKLDSGAFERAALPLAPRSAYCLRDAARHEWYHSITPMETERFSVTFRSLRESREPSQA